MSTSDRVNLLEADYVTSFCLNCEKTDRSATVQSLAYKALAYSSFIVVHTAIFLSRTDNSIRFAWRAPYGLFINSSFLVWVYSTIGCIRSYFHYISFSSSWACY